MVGRNQRHQTAFDINRGHGPERGGANGHKISGKLLN